MLSFWLSDWDMRFANIVEKNSIPAENHKEPSYCLSKADSSGSYCSIYNIEIKKFKSPICHVFCVSAAWHDKGGSTVDTPPPPFDFWAFVFVNVDCIIRIYFNCSQHAMFTICILLLPLTTKASRICEGYKKNPNPKNSTVSWPPPGS